MAFIYDKEASTNLIQNIRELDSLYDAILVAGSDKKKFPVHKIVMAASSRYFNALFGPNFLEAQQNEVVLKEIDGSTLKTIIDYCYCCKIELNDENVDDIMAAASRMELLLLAQQCENYWLSNLDIKNCLKTLTLADTYNLQSLWKDSLLVACDNFEQLPETDLMQIDERNFKSILTEDVIRAPEDTIAYRFVMWILHDEANRKKFVPTLAKLIRLEHISETAMGMVMESFYKKHGCFGFVMAEKLKRSQNQMPITLNRVSQMDKLYAVEMIYDDDSKNRIAIHEFIEESKTFNNLFEVTFGGDVENVLSLDRNLFVFLCDTTNWCLLDLVTKTKKPLPQLPFKNHSSPVLVGHYIYIFNGFDLFGPRTHNFARFDTERLLWEYRKSLPFEFHDLTAVELNGLIYAAGEMPAKNFHSSNFWCYDPSEDSWSEKTRINTIIKGGKHLIKVKKFICLNNYNIDTIMIYDAHSNQWNTEWNVNDSKQDNPAEQRIYQTVGFRGRTYGIVSCCRKYYCVNLEATAKTCKVSYISSASFRWMDVGVFVSKSITDK